MAMAVDDRATAQLRRRKIRGGTGQELIEQQRVFRERLRMRQARKERRQLVAKGQYATWFEADDFDAPLGIGRERFHSIEHAGARAVEHSLVIQRTSAANVARRQRDTKTCTLEDRGRGDRHFGLEEIVEGVREQEHFRSLRIARRVSLEPTAER